MKMNKKGFTLIEMLVVIAIIAVLVSIIIPTVTSATDKAAAAANAANLRSLKAEVVTAYLTNDTSVYSFTDDAVGFPASTVTCSYNSISWKDCATAEDHDSWVADSGVVGTIDDNVIELTYRGLTVNEWAALAG